MNSYCSNGHRVSYSGIKPATCPTCNVSMSAVANVATVAAQPPPPGARRGRWVEDDEPADDGDNPFAVTRVSRESVAAGGFDLEVHKDPGDVGRDGKIMTVEQLRANGGSIERNEPSAPPGNRATTANDLVQKMLGGAGGGGGS